MTISRLWGWMRHHAMFTILIPQTARTSTVVNWKGMEVYTHHDQTHDASMCSFSGLGAEYMAGQVFRYKVDGMLQGPEAFIVNVNSGRPHPALWSIQRRKDRTGKYKTAEEALAALQKETDEVRNEKTVYAVCPDGHWPLFDNRPKEVDICWLCGVPKKLTGIGEGFVSHEERNRGWADSFPLETPMGPGLLDRL